MYSRRQKDKACTAGNRKTRHVQLETERQGIYSWRKTDKAYTAGDRKTRHVQLETERHVSVIHACTYEEHSESSDFAYTMNETEKCLTLLPTLMRSFWWLQCSE